jgi:hypothetical protein
MATRNAEVLRTLRAKAKAEGKCSVCRARDARAGLLTCAECQGDSKRRQRAWKRQGKCITCGWPRAEGNACYCLVHRRKTAERELRRSAERRAVGLCWCGQPPDGGGTQCAKHRIYRRDAARAAAGYRGGLKSCGACGRAGHNRRTCTEAR